jgi:hypothetical protein
MNKKLGTLITIIAGAALVAAIACGTSATATPPPGAPPPMELEEAAAPIEEVELVIAESNPLSTCSTSYPGSPADEPNSRNTM